MLRSRRRRYERLKALYGSIVTHSGLEAYAYLLPSVDDLLQLSSFKSLVEDDNMDDIDLEGWETLLHSIPQVIQRHSVGMFSIGNSEVVAVLRELKAESQSGSSKYPFDVTDLISAFDTAKSADTLTEWNLCIMAFSFFKVENVWFQNLPFDQTLAKVRSQLKGHNPWLENHFMTQPWDGTGIKASKDMMRVAIELLKALEMPWESTKMLDMAVMGPCFACARCPRVKSLMTWTKLVCFIDLKF